MVSHSFLKVKMSKEQLSSCLVSFSPIRESNCVLAGHSEEVMPARTCASGAACNLVCARRVNKDCHRWDLKHWPVADNTRHLSGIDCNLTADRCDNDRSPPINIVSILPLRKYKWRRRSSCNPSLIITRDTTAADSTNHSAPSHQQNVHVFMSWPTYDEWKQAHFLFIAHHHPTNTCL